MPLYDALSRLPDIAKAAEDEDREWFRHEPLEPAQNVAQIRDVRVAKEALAFES